ncbi:hypothetical protein CRE_28746 [Caenorhabditis remanei]|uniref:SPK domain-containing protein n=1 Tax=Caenorhabditis remanei TaxID=31234 RepID=E3MKA0_CAERE|nr:hypothetical protein CRE_28746 [Caenorhabditis remanei]
MECLDARPSEENGAESVIQEEYIIEDDDEDLIIMDEQNENQRNRVKEEDEEESTLDEPNISLTCLLKTLWNFVYTLDSPLLAKLRTNIEKEILLLKYTDKQISIKTLDMAMKAALYMMTKKPTHEIEGETWGLKEVLKMFRSITSKFARQSKQLEDLEKQVREEIRKSTVREKKVMMIQVRTAIETALKILVP